MFKYRVWREGDPEKRGQVYVVGYLNAYQDVAEIFAHKFFEYDIDLVLNVRELDSNKLRRIEISIRENKSYEVRIQSSLPVLEEE